MWGEKCLFQFAVLYHSPSSKEGRAGTEASGLLSLLSLYDSGPPDQWTSPPVSWLVLINHETRKQPTDLPIGNLMDPFSQLRFIFPDNPILYQVDKTRARPGSWSHGICSWEADRNECRCLACLPYPFSFS